MNILLNKPSTFDLQDSYPLLPYLTNRAESCELCSFVLAAIRSKERFRPSFSSTDLGSKETIEMIFNAREFRTLSFRQEISGTLEVNPKGSSSRNDPTRRSRVRALINLHSHNEKNSDIRESVPTTIPINQARKFLRRCQHKHSHREDHATEQFRPTRLVHIVDRENARLDEKSDPIIKYAALSYRWGPPPFPAKTVKANLARRLETLPISDLPQTIKDSIHLTQELGLKYIWIDSLCIVQDDDEDWKKEAARMKLVYRSSWVTIAALESTAVSQSFLQKSAPLTLAVCLAHQEEAPSYPDRLDFQFSPCDDYQYPVSTLGRLISTSTWATRGWMLQEQLLSTRIIYFAGETVIFECSASIFYGDDRHVIEKDSGNVHTPPRWLRSYLGIGRDFDIGFANLQPYDQWYEMLKTYTSRALTYSKDKMPAIEGLARQVAAAIHDEYICGLWKNDLSRGLLWCCSERKGNGLGSHDAPSWSWISVNAPVYWGDWLFNLSTKVITHIVELQETSHISSDSGTPRERWISIHGPLLLIDDVRHFKKLTPSIFEGPHPRRMTFYFDLPHQSPVQRISIVPTVVSDSHVEGTLIHGIVLERIKGSQMYRRIGVASARKEAMHWRDEDITTIKVV